MTAAAAYQITNPTDWPGFTARQNECIDAVLNTDARNILLVGGSRSGKTFLLVWAIVIRALKASKSRHAIMRFRFNHVKASIILDTFPKVMELCFPGVKFILNKTDSYATFENKSEIWFGGLDDKERTEKILGQEHATLYFNEASQIPYSSIQTAITRLAQRVRQKIDGIKYFDQDWLTPRCFFDANPPSKSHYLYKMFVKKINGDTNLPLGKPENYLCFYLNPGDNLDNLSEGYIETLQGLSARQRQRFLHGQWADATPGQLFRDEDIDRWRVTDGVIPQLTRVVVAVDPSGSDDTDNVDNDEIGIVTAGLGVDGNAYILEDATLKCGPATWGRMAVIQVDKHQADCMVGEGNYGGAMVHRVIQAACRDISHRPVTFRLVTATRGKHVRAEPYSALYEQGRVRHVGVMSRLEDELTAFSTAGYTGEGSPNRADAAIWALTELFGGIVHPKKQIEIMAPTWEPSDPGMGLMG